LVQAYNYMLESFPVNRDVKYPVSKRSELKRVYNHIVDLSKRTPFYKVDLSKQNQEYTFGIKEAALALKTKINDMSEPEVSGFLRKKVAVSDPKLLSAELLSSDTDGLPDKIQFQIKSLATEQTNSTKELLKTSHSLPVGNYKFLVKVKDETYSLSYTQKERTNNQESMLGLADFLNQSVPGISAVVAKGSSKDYLKTLITSETTGSYQGRNFSFEDQEGYKEGIVSIFGLDRMESAPENASFELNGVEKTTTSNTFTLENIIQISLHDVGDQPVYIKVTPDGEKILSAVDSVLSTYNRLVRLAKDRMQGSHEHYKAAKLLNEMKSLQNTYKEELEACGLKASEDGILEMEEVLAVQAAEDGGMESLFTRENGFIARLIDKADTIAINPMEYLDKTIVTYPNNLTNSYRNPYMTSMYSGLFFNSYC
jgi:flagellar hook-associated protein 2